MFDSKISRKIGICISNPLCVCCLDVIASLYLEFVLGSEEYVSRPWNANLSVRVKNVLPDGQHMKYPVECLQKCT
jgi:hypothetical protein